MAIETARTFQPINEFGGPAYFTRLYEHRLDAGTCCRETARSITGAAIQITGQANYRAYTQAAGVPLRIILSWPGAVPRPASWPRSSRRMASTAANAQDWRKVRRLVNGGYNGWDEFNACVCALLEAINALLQLRPWRPLQ